MIHRKRSSVSTRCFSHIRPIIFGTLVLTSLIRLQLYTQYQNPSVDDIFQIIIPRDTSGNILSSDLTSQQHPSTVISNDTLQIITPQNTSENELLTDLLGFSSDAIWDQICREGGNIVHKNQVSNAPPVVAMEVGVYDGQQCYFAADTGMHAHCIEPSPKNYKRVETLIKSKKNTNSNKEKEAANLERMFIYNMAAGNASGGTIPFFASGGTGDHAGEFDMWNMAEGFDGEKDFPTEKKSKRTDVSTVKVDDIINNIITPTNRKENDLSSPKIQDVFVLKVDTQGFEPTVFSGLGESINMKKIDFILFEYWPKGMDLLSSSDTKCAESVAILKQLDAAKYKLYALRVQAHPRSPLTNREMNAPDNGRRFDNFESNCNWYYELEKRFPKDTYKMGYWSDIFAVSPNAKLSGPVTQLGQIVSKN